MCDTERNLGAASGSLHPSFEGLVEPALSVVRAPVETTRRLAEEPDEQTVYSAVDTAAANFSPPATIGSRRVNPAGAVEWDGISWHLRRNIRG